MIIGETGGLRMERVTRPYVIFDHAELWVGIGADWFMLGEYLQLPLECGDMWMCYSQGCVFAKRRQSALTTNTTYCAVRLCLKMPEGAENCFGIKYCPLLLDCPSGPSEIFCPIPPSGSTPTSQIHYTNSDSIRQSAYHAQTYMYHETEYRRVTVIRRGSSNALPSTRLPENMNTMWRRDQLSIPPLHHDPLGAIFSTPYFCIILLIIHLFSLL